MDIFYMNVHWKQTRATAKAIHRKTQDKSGDGH